MVRALRGDSVNITGRAIYAKPEHRVTVAEGKAHMGRVAQLPCVICHEWNMPQLSATQVHHVIHGRGSNRRAPDTHTIPLCEGHHQGNFDTSKVSLHREPKEWQRLYGPDRDWLGWVEKKLGDDE
jgi:hypothetical protein